MPVLKKNPKSKTVWQGPEQDGVTFSLLSRFLCCRERFRLLVMEGLKPADHFNAKMEFGSMWHACEEALASNSPHKDHGWEFMLLAYARKLASKYRGDQEQIDHWYNVVKAQFPAYVRWWEEHPDVLERRPLEQEKTFAVPYALPSGRKVLLRGKRDAVDLIGKKDPKVYIQENKTKNKIMPELIRRQLNFDLQTMLYVVSWLHDPDAGYESEGRLASDVPPYAFGGVRYNVIRRDCPIRRHKATKSKPEEGKAEFYARLRTDYFEANPEEWFFRWKVEITPQDVAKFRRECLDPILENLCDWWEYVNHPSFGVAEAGSWMKHWRHPFGVYNVLNEGGSSDLDEYLMTGSTVGLERVDELFPELQ